VESNPGPPKVSENEKVERVIERGGRKVGQSIPPTWPIRNCLRGGSRTEPTQRPYSSADQASLLSHGVRGWGVGGNKSLGEEAYQVQQSPRGLGQCRLSLRGGPSEGLGFYCKRIRRFEWPQGYLHQLGQLRPTAILHKLWSLRGNRAKRVQLSDG